MNGVKENKLAKNFIQKCNMKNYCPHFIYFNYLKVIFVWDIQKDSPFCKMLIFHRLLWNMQCWFDVYFKISHRKLFLDAAETFFEVLRRASSFVFVADNVWMFTLYFIAW